MNTIKKENQFVDYKRIISNPNYLQLPFLMKEANQEIKYVLKSVGENSIRFEHVEKNCCYCRKSTRGLEYFNPSPSC